MRELLLENSSKPMEEQESILTNTLESWIEEGKDEQIDDVCIIGVKI